MVVWPHWLRACSEAAYYSGGAHDVAKLLHLPDKKQRKRRRDWRPMIPFKGRPPTSVTYDFPLVFFEEFYNIQTTPS